MASMTHPDRAKKDSLEEARLIAIQIHSPKDKWTLEEFFNEAVEDSAPLIAKALSAAKQRGFEEGLEAAINKAINVIPCESICHCAAEVAEEINALKAPKK